MLGHACMLVRVCTDWNYEGNTASSSVICKLEGQEGCCGSEYKCLGTGTKAGSGEWLGVGMSEHPKLQESRNLISNGRDECPKEESLAIHLFFSWVPQFNNGIHVSDSHLSSVWWYKCWPLLEIPSKMRPVIKSYQLPGHSTTLLSWHINVSITDFLSQTAGASDLRKSSINKTEASTELSSCPKKPLQVGVWGFLAREKIGSTVPWRNIQGSRISEEPRKLWEAIYPFYSEEHVPPYPCLLAYRPPCCNCYWEF